ncbi:MAG: nucleotide exchange factor GrpE [Patescibacteria group bacterium]
MKDEEKIENRNQNDDQTSQQAPFPAKGRAGDGSVIGSDEGGFEKIIAERDEYLAGWKRAKADYDNLVKESDRKRGEYADWATEQVLSKLLPAIDQYDVALQFAPSFDVIPEQNRKAFDLWLTGLKAVQALWIDAAKELGLERVRTEGEFDPTIHEAVSEEQNETIPSGQIIKATMNGYTLKGKVIRCAKVIVSKGTEL